MYFPYLRGRQNELLCLRELLAKDRLSEKVVPVIEPVRFNSTLFTTLSAFIENNRRIILIANPQVGKYEEDKKSMLQKISDETDLAKKKKLEESFADYEKILSNDMVLKAYLAKSTLLNQFIKNNDDIKSKIIINSNDECYDLYEDYGDELDAYLTFIPKRNEDFKDFLGDNVVLLEDCFTKAKRNIDYINKPDEIFSRNHISFQKKGYKGFSDYSIVGDAFEESGFAPLAIAIHIVYRGNKDVLYVHHFVSNSNENISDPARKFEEAMNNLVNWENYENITKTYGLNVLIDYFNNGKFPGLGVIKKCSIMHHMEVIGKYLEEQK